MPLRVLELFAGIGGLACSWPNAKIVTAVDISHIARGVYEANHVKRREDSPFLVRSIESLKTEFFENIAADVWWLSPPCQPFTSKGRKRGLADARSAGLSNILRQIGLVQPWGIALENVPGFEDSEAHCRLISELNANKYSVWSGQLCPTQLGWPNRRERLYVIACKEPLHALSLVPAEKTPKLSDMLEANEQAVSDLWLDGETAEACRGSLDRVDWCDADAVTACFGSGYGRSLLHCGSYLEVGGRLRRFSPREVARLLGFPDSFDLSVSDEYSGGLTPRKERLKLWQLLGNSLALPVVSRLEAMFPERSGK